MSIGFLLKDRGDSVVWRGPKKDGMIRQFLAEVRWGDLDYLVIDTPPGEFPRKTPSKTSYSMCLITGTSDEHISLLTHLHPLFLPNPNRPPPTFCPTPTCVLITTPQTTALNDTLKSLSFTRKLSLPVLGLVENMAGYVCPCCGEISDIFSKGGGQEMAQKEGIGWLGRVPIDTKLVKLLDDVVKGSVENVSPAQDGETVYVATRPDEVSFETTSSPKQPTDTTEDFRKLDVSGNPAANSDKQDASDPQSLMRAGQAPFPLLDLYLETTSSKVWKDITDGVLQQIKERGEEMAASVRANRS